MQPPPLLSWNNYGLIRFLVCIEMKKWMPGSREEVWAGVGLTHWDIFHANHVVDHEDLYITIISETWFKWNRRNQSIYYTLLPANTLSAYPYKNRVFIFRINLKMALTRNECSSFNWWSLVSELTDTLAGLHLMILGNNSRILQGFA